MINTTKIDLKLWSIIFHMRRDLWREVARTVQYPVWFKRGNYHVQSWIQK
jgi:hypothetical protein